MHPTLIEIRGFPIGMYGVMLAVGFYLAIIVTERRAKYFGFGRGESGSLAVWLLVGGIVGARLWFIAISWSEFLSDPWSLIFSRGALVFFGAIVAGVLAGFFWVRRHGYSFWEGADWIAPGIALGHAVGRIGCFLKGCCFGERTMLPWALRFPPESEVYRYHEWRYPDVLGVGAEWSLPVHPVQLYSVFFLLGLFVFLLWLTPRRRFSGQLFWTYGVVYAGYRFLVEFLREDLRGMIGPLSSSQVLCLVILVSAPVVYARLSRRPVPVSTAPREDESKGGKAEGRASVPASGRKA